MNTPLCLFRRASLGAITLLLVAGNPTIALAKDLEGSKDHPLLKRFEGSEIIRYSSKKYDRYTLALGSSLQGDKFGNFDKQEILEGSLTRIAYRASDTSSLEVFRNYEIELADKGFQPIAGNGDKPLSGAAKEFANDTLYFPWAVDCQGVQGGEVIPRWHSKNPYYFAGKLDRSEGTAYASVVVVEASADSPKFKANDVLIIVDIVESRALQNKMVQVNASEMRNSIEKTGKVTLYGIYFDTDKTAIKTESMPTIAEIAKLLQNDLALKLMVVGHTDNVGTVSHNAELSMGRAQSVVKELQSKYGINGQRLQSAGMGFMVPVAANDTEDGRAKNRRVELVKI
jgi:outer membrane protein OmpA-like peptidoglycan-associated protein